MSTYFTALAEATLSLNRGNQREKKLPTFMFGYTNYIPMRLEKYIKNIYILECLN